MFGFMDMAFNQEQRKVARFESGKLIVDTCMVTDSTEPFETAVSHPKYKGGKWIIVELYSTNPRAKEGHDKWVKLMTTEPLPKSLTDVSTCDVVDLGKALGVDLNETFEREE